MTSASNLHIAILFLLVAWSNGASNSNQRILVCPRNKTSSNEMKLDTYDPISVFNEVSGLVFSKTQFSPLGNPIFYVISDGKNNNDHAIGGGRVGVYDSGTGKRLLSYVFSNNTEENWDYEAMTLGSCGPGKDFQQDDQCVYVGDTGDNVAISANGKRTDRGDTWPYRIIKFREPQLDVLIGQDNYTIADSDIWILPFNYNHSTSPRPFADSEALFLDHTGWGEDSTAGDLYVLTKWGGTRSLRHNRIFKIDATTWEQEPERKHGDVSFLPMLSPATVGTYWEGAPFLQHQWRGADMLHDGTVISLTTVNETHLFLRCPGESVADALTGNNGTTKACFSWGHAATGQTETSAWTTDGLRYLQIPEGRKTRLGWSDMTYDDPSSPTRVCPIQEAEIQAPAPTAAGMVRAPTRPPQGMVTTDMDLPPVTVGSQTIPATNAPLAAWDRSDEYADVLDGITVSLGGDRPGTLAKEEDPLTMNRSGCIRRLDRLLVSTSLVGPLLLLML